MTPQNTPLNLFLHFTDGTSGHYPVVGWIQTQSTGRYVYSPVIAMWDNRVAITIYPTTTEIPFGDTEKVITSAYFGASL